MRLKEHRKRAGMTQGQVAELLGIPKRTYQNYELESREPDSDTLCALADLYRTSLDDLVGRAAPQPVGPRAELARLFDSMDDCGRRALLDVARSLSLSFPKEA